MKYLLEAVNGAANMMRGMTMDRSIPQTARNAMALKISELEAASVRGITELEELDTVLSEIEAVLEGGAS